MNLDLLKRFPNQNSEKRETECVGECISDIVGNLSATPCDAGFSYAAALRVANKLPTTAGSEPYAGMLGGLIYGALETDKVPFDVNTMDELYEANWNNYGPIAKRFAALNVQNGIQILRNYDDVVTCLEAKIPVCLALSWHQSFASVFSDGILPIPTGRSINHCVAVYESTPQGLRIKPWLGPEYGEGGYAYLPRTIFDIIRISAYAYNPRSSRWLSLAYTGCFRPWLLTDILPQLKI